MRCDEFEIRLHELLDRRVAPDDDAVLCSHAEQCGECAELMSLYVSMTGAIRFLPQSSAPASMPFEVLHRIDQDQQRDSVNRHENSRWRQVAAAVLAVSAGFMIAFTIWGLRRPEVNGPGETSPRLVASAGADQFDYDKFAEETQQFADYIATRQLQMMSELAEGMRPVASSFGAALETLRNTLPYGAGATRTSSG